MASPAPLLPWHSTFATRSPAFAPFAPIIAQWKELSDWPSIESLNSPALRAVCDDAASTPRFVDQTLIDDRPLSYEQRIFQSNEVPTRARNWHDLFNALVWLAYPRAKKALNNRHIDAWEQSSDDSGRGKTRDALTVFDESGIVLVSSSMELLDMIRGFEWHRVFWERRAFLRDDLEAFVFGHAVLEKLLTPYLGLTAKALLFHVDRRFHDLSPERKRAALDTRISEIYAAGHPVPLARDLQPFPVLGLPGWDANEDENYYLDTTYFRPAGIKRQTEISTLHFK